MSKCYEEGFVNMAQFSCRIPGWFGVFVQQEGQYKISMAVDTRKSNFESQ